MAIRKSLLISMMMNRDPMSAVIIDRQMEKKGITGSKANRIAAFSAMLSGRAPAGQLQIENVVTAMEMVKKEEAVNQKDAAELKLSKLNSTLNNSDLMSTYFKESEYENFKKNILSPVLLGQPITTGSTTESK